MSIDDLENLPVGEETFGVAIERTVDEPVALFREVEDKDNTMIAVAVDPDIYRDRRVFGAMAIHPQSTETGVANAELKTRSDNLEDPALLGLFGRAVLEHANMDVIYIAPEDTNVPEGTLHNAGFISTKHRGEEVFALSMAEAA